MMVQKEIVLQLQNAPGSIIVKTKSVLRWKECQYNLDPSDDYAF